MAKHKKWYVRYIVGNLDLFTKVTTEGDRKTMASLPSVKTLSFLGGICLITAVASFAPPAHATEPVAGDQDALTSNNGEPQLDFSKEVASLPDLPSRDHCEQLVAASGADQEAFERCMKLEEKAYYQLESSFMDHPAEDRTMCANVAIGMKMGYMGLRHCLNYHR